VSRWQFWIDVGGTFTDCVARSPDGNLTLWKTLSSGAVKGTLKRHTDRTQIHDALRTNDPPGFWTGWTITCPTSQGEWTSPVIDSTSEGVLTLPAPLPDGPVGPSYELRCDEPAPLICLRRILQLRLIDPIPAVDIRMGTTRGTNALLERKGARTALLVTRGFADLLEIGNQDRPDLFALNIQKRKPLAARTVEIDERLTADGSILLPLDEDQALRTLRSLRDARFDSLAICLLHSYRNPIHERRLEKLAQQLGFKSISCSSQVAPLIKAVPRGETTVLDAYLNPVLRDYVDQMECRLGPGSSLRLMTSQGGLVQGSEFSGKDSILSGPAGGVIAFAKLAQAAGFDQAIGFDMGGTSTDVSRFDGTFDLETESVKAGVRIATPLLSIETVAAGGGSLCGFDGLMLTVGPASAGADPGPACYGRGGPLSMTDMNLILGRVLPEHFPFPLDTNAVTERLDAVLSELEQAGSPLESRWQLAQGFVEIANETMARAIRAISIRKGYNPADHLLVCFGGAGGQHACALARMLGMTSILIHPFAGVLSAYGMGQADIRRREEQSVLLPASPESIQQLERRFRQMTDRLTADILAEGIPEQDLSPPVRSLRLRYQGVEASIVVTEPADGDYRAAYENQHEQFFGYRQSDRPLEIVSLIVDLVGALPSTVPTPLSCALSEVPIRGARPVWFRDTQLEVPLYHRDDLRAGHRLSGPAILCEEGSTVWIEPDFTGVVQTDGSLLIHLTGKESAPERGHDDETIPDPVALEIFNHQFASIAEQMGITLRKTSISTNVKERLDYSCALFDAQGGLVVNAPHIPVHLGAMGETVKCLLQENPVLHPGDVLMTNDPYSGGSHLPDLTVVTPVHDPETNELLFLTASRAHHAEIGGMTPGSMPPFSTTLGEEGVLIRNFKIVDQGVSRFEEFLALLTSGRWPSRRPGDNIADVTAQIAANKIGATLLQDLIRHSGKLRVQRYMRFIQNAAEFKMRRALSAFPDGVYRKVDHLDDGSPIAVTITIHHDTARIDFTGTGPVLKSNLNANRAIVTAAVLYVFRCLIDEPIPLNSGVLQPLELVLPECLLNPPAQADRSLCAAMVGGNVETSQRVVDVLLGALGKAAASQGTMNNLTFGDGTFGYYETICGGAGATESAAGADAVHTHMTNTRLTDVEVFESRYPVRIQEFSIRRGSGGSGTQRGGHGIRRVFEFLTPLSVSLLTQRRGTFLPFGLQQGQSGAPGRNMILRSGSGGLEMLGGAAALQVQTGDKLIIETPGGGGYGAPWVCESASRARQDSFIA